MARHESFSDQYWSQTNNGQGAATNLKQDHYSEYSAFTGTDIKAFILPQGDQVARRELQRRLKSIDDEIANNENGLNLEQFNGEFYATEQERTSVNGGKASKDFVPLVNLQSITISTHRAKSQVRALGHVNAVGLARGTRTVAGTFILTEFAQDAFWDVLTAPYRDINPGDSGPIQADQMRPFDILLLFASEMGDLAIRHIYGLDIVTNGVVYSIQDYYSENTVSYLAHDVSPLIPLGPAFAGDKFSSLTGSRLKLNNLISSLRTETLQQDFDYLRKSRNPFR